MSEKTRDYIKFAIIIAMIIVGVSGMISVSFEEKPIKENPATRMCINGHIYGQMKLNNLGIAVFPLYGEDDKPLRCDWEK